MLDGFFDSLNGRPFANVVFLWQSHLQLKQFCNYRQLISPEKMFFIRYNVLIHDARIESKPIDFIAFICSDVRLGVRQMNPHHTKLNNPAL